MTVEAAIASRRSKRNFSSRPLSRAQLSQLLFAASGLTDGNGRSAPSAGATYPIEIYVVIHNVETINQGIYHYNVQNQALEVMKLGDYRKQITNAGQEQSMLGDAAAVFVLSAIFDRVCMRYGDRGYRYSYMEAGHISQNIYLQAQSLGLGSVSLGGFIDHQVNALLGLDGDLEAVIYLHAVGAL
jgi:SagB-type dehydrogenase family enzyme